MTATGRAGRCLAACCLPVEMLTSIKASIKASFHRGGQWAAEGVRAAAPPPSLPALADAGGHYSPRATVDLDAALPRRAPQRLRCECPPCGSYDSRVRQLLGSSAIVPRVIRWPSHGRIQDPSGRPQ